jgi:hypothetical protein
MAGSVNVIAAAQPCSSGAKRFTLWPVIIHIPTTGERLETRLSSDDSGLLYLNILQGVRQAGWLPGGPSIAARRLQAEGTALGGSSALSLTMPMTVLRRRGE